MSDVKGIQLAMHDDLPPDLPTREYAAPRIPDLCPDEHGFDAAPAVVAYIERGGLLLSVSRKDSGLAAAPGGKLEPGESLRSGLEREVREEAGVEIVSAREVYRGLHKSGRVVVAFRCMIVGEPVAVEEGTVVEWVPPRSLAEGFAPEYHRQALVAAGFGPDLQRQACTSFTARWCPQCGSCQCAFDETTGCVEEWGKACPLHGETSTHAVIAELAAMGADALPTPSDKELELAYCEAAAKVYEFGAGVADYAGRKAVAGLVYARLAPIIAAKDAELSEVNASNAALCTVLSQVMIALGLANGERLVEPVNHAAVSKAVALADERNAALAEAETLRKRVAILEIAPKAAAYANAIEGSMADEDDAEHAAEVIERGFGDGAWDRSVLEYVQRLADSSQGPTNDGIDRTTATSRYCFWCGREGDGEVYEYEDGDMGSRTPLHESCATAFDAATRNDQSNPLRKVAIDKAKP